MSAARPTIGRFVQVNLGRTETPHWRPALVVAVQHDESINAQVFLDGSNDKWLVECLLQDHCGMDSKGALTAATMIAADRGMWHLTSLKPGDDVMQWRWPPLRATTDG